MNKKQMIVSFIWSNKWLVVLAVLINALSGYTRTKGSAYLEYITDAVGLRQADRLVELAIIGAVIMVSSYVFRWLGACLCMYLSSKLAFETRQKLIAHLEKVPFLKYEQLSTGDIQSVLINDTADAANIIYNIFSRILNNVFLFVFSTMYMLTIHATITVVIVTITIAMGFLNSRLLKSIKKEKSESRKSLGRLTTLLESTYKGAGTIKTYNAQDYAKRVFVRQVDNYNEQMLNCERLDCIRLTIYNIVNNIALYGSMVYMGYLGINGTISVSQAVVLIYLIKQILIPIEVIFRWMFSLISSVAAWERIENIFKIPVEEEVDRKELSTQTLNITGLSFSYDGEKTLFEHINGLKFQEGKSYLLQGSSGSGKTTLLKLLMGLYNNSKLKINGDAKSSLKGHCAYSSASFELFPLSIYENITLGDSNITREACYDIINKLGFKEWIDSLENGIDTIVQNTGSNFSGGQKQMIVNARALLSNRRIVILDEPFSALDKEHEDALSKVLEKERGKRILLITSHRPVKSGVCQEEIKTI